MAYQHCPRCHKRMIRFAQDEDDQRFFYLCRDCGNRSTLMVEMNGISDDWPKAIFDKAVTAGVIRKDGRVLRV